MTPCATFPGAGGFSEQQRHPTSPFPSPQGVPCLQQWLLLLVQCLQEDAHLKSASRAEGQCRKWFETQAKWLQQVTASFLHTLVTISNLFNLILFYLNNWRKEIIGKRSLLCLPPSIRRCLQTFALRQAFLGVVDTKQPHQSPLAGCGLQLTFNKARN